MPRDPQETLKIHQRGSKRVPRGSKRVPRRTLGRSEGLFRSLLGSLLEALGLTFTQKYDYHDFWHAKISICDACRALFGPKSACSMPVHRILVENASFLWKSHGLRRLSSAFRSTCSWKRSKNLPPKRAQPVNLYSKEPESNLKENVRRQTTFPLATTIHGTTRVNKVLRITS